MNRISFFLIFLGGRIEFWYKRVQRDQAATRPKRHQQTNQIFYWTLLFLKKDICYKKKHLGKHNLITKVQYGLLFI